MKKIVTGIKPTGKLTLGNYIGVLKHLKDYQNDFETYFFVADLHALTLPIDPVELRNNTRQIAALVLASGLDISRATVFIQSHVKAHSELAIILQNYAYMGELNRMTQFKEKTEHLKNNNIGAGLYNYPILMAADILLYDCEFVPVGEDQKQHVELTRNLAERLNNRYNQEIFVIPTPIIPRTGARIKSLSEPTKKMSKSDPKGDIYLLEDLTSVRKKINRAVTDSDDVIEFDPENKPGVSNLLTIYSSLTNQSIEESEKHFLNQNYGTLKREVGDVVIQELEKLQKRYQEIINSPELDRILKEGEEKAAKLADAVLVRVKKAVGLHLRITHLKQRRQHR